MNETTMGINGKNRVYDVIFSSLALVLLSPLFVLVSLGILSTSKGGVIYRQTRLGRNRRPFIMYKFRTMETEAEINGPQLTVPNDPRITSIGKYLRKYHIDEWPQFWNVLKGDMSIIGPRPEREMFAKEIEKLLPEFKRIFDINPGVTSLGMIKKGYASSVSEMVERAKVDLDYLDKKSPALEAKIIANTVITVLKGKGI